MTPESNGTSSDKQSIDPLRNAKRDLSSFIDHTLLKADATHQQIKKACEEAKKYHFATVCVNSSYISYVSDLLKGSGVKPICVVGFPLGAMATEAKVLETQFAIRNGAQEIDMVIHLGALKSGNLTQVRQDIQAVVMAAKPIPVKVILETASLTRDEKIKVCQISKEVGAAFVKTSTGFGAGGATAEDIRLMRETVGPEMGVKASGGVRTYEDAIKMIEAGANRIGASSSVDIVTHSRGTESTY